MPGRPVKAAADEMNQKQPARAFELEHEAVAKLKKMGVKVVDGVDKTGFQTVSKPIQDKLAKDLGPNAVKILEARPLPMVSVDPKDETMLLVERENLPPIKDLAKPMWRLAGMRIDPDASGPHGPRRFTGLELLSIASGERRPVTLPATHRRPSHENASNLYTRSGTSSAFRTSVR